ncbi:hypothetical protein M422DRAFT_260187 [Sphaerobolus stellatus SS14]|uniref:Uncharacterized protein n=1 Tax=Sphaerobolus stellatus (strain SS14) TaxID=990650 RepID=A0A0C9VI97_SPHS4|nr:hypothetical protein M422DRAFT_260187 [Sphaerobolus stellatus SS14]
MAKRHSKTVENILGRMQHIPAGALSSGKRAVNPRNAYSHMLNIEIDSGLPEDQQACQRALQEIVLNIPYKDLSDEQITMLNEELEDFRLQKKVGYRNTVGGQVADVQQTVDWCRDELSGLASRCSASAILLIVPGDDSAIFDCQVYVDQTSAKFVEMGLGVDVPTLGKHFHSFAQEGLKGMSMNCQLKMKNLKDFVSRKTVAGLQNITGNKALEMSYAKYECDIVDAYQVIIIGWPFLKRFSPPSKWSSLMYLEGLAEALVRKEGEVGLRCFWKKFSAEEYEARKERFNAMVEEEQLDQVKPQKQRSDAGIVRGPRKTTSTESDEEQTSPTESSEEDSNDEGDIDAAGGSKTQVQKKKMKRDVQGSGNRASKWSRVVSKEEITSDLENDS